MERAGFRARRIFCFEAIRSGLRGGAGVGAIPANACAARESRDPFAELRVEKTIRGGRQYLGAAVGGWAECDHGEPRLHARAGCAVDPAAVDRRERVVYNWMLRLQS